MEKVLADWEVQAEEQLPPGDPTRPKTGDTKAETGFSESDLERLNQELETLAGNVSERLEELARRDPGDPTYIDYRDLNDRIDEMRSVTEAMAKDEALSQEQRFFWTRMYVSMLRRLRQDLDRITE
ncbi:MAG: hypothetical protein HYY50_01735 [Candidatus Kerfeldbacteria bacterium]|nr:hypothetical protein [Candidatus Kerfeldbacteria bacterium]